MILQILLRLLLAFVASFAVTYIFVYVHYRGYAKGLRDGHEDAQRAINLYRDRVQEIAWNKIGATNLRSSIQNGKTQTKAS